MYCCTWGWRWGDYLWGFEFRVSLGGFLGFCVSGLAWTLRFLVGVAVYLYLLLSERLDYCFLWCRFWDGFEYVTLGLMDGAWIGFDCVWVIGILCLQCLSVRGDYVVFADSIFSFMIITLMIIRCDVAVMGLI